MQRKRSAGAGNGPGEPRWFAMETRLVLHILAVVTLVAASLTAMADQSGRLVGVHELPPFVTERVELPPGAVAGRPKPGELAQPVRPASAG
jgi:hypothetical protein